MPTLHLDVSITALYALHLLGETGNMSRVAQEIGVTQSAVSRMIATLETKYGLPLLKRSSRPLELTQEGKMIAEVAAGVDQQLARLNDQMQRLHSYQEGTITLASFGASSSTHFLPNLVKEFQKKHSKISVSVQEYDHSDQFIALSEGEADFGVLVNASSALEAIPLGHDELFAVLRPDDPLMEKEFLTPEDLDTREFILTRAGSAPLIKSWFREDMRKPNVQHNIRQILSILGMVKAGLGVSILARLAMPQNIDPLVLRPLRPTVKREISLVRPHTNTSSFAADTFWKFAKEFFGQKEVLKG